MTSGEDTVQILNFELLLFSLVQCRCLLHRWISAMPQGVKLLLLNVIKSNNQLAVCSFDKGWPSVSLLQLLLSHFISCCFVFYLESLGVIMQSNNCILKSKRKENVVLVDPDFSFKLYFLSLRPVCTTLSECSLTLSSASLAGILKATNGSWGYALKTMAGFNMTLTFIKFSWCLKSSVTCQSCSC